ncbi:MAG: isoprenylcysteine carboxylmethyltransferase family protein [Anaerolineales bacterium]|nr:isoprenylcysteine carboxylmethyltransferase family protein [Anaerolineales bacterium]
MNNPGSDTPDIANGSLKRGIVRWAIKQTVFLLIIAAALFFSAGSCDWTSGWLYWGFIAFVQVITALLLIPRSPGLLVERSQLKEGLKAWDIGLAVFMGYSSAFLALAAGFETRYNPPPSEPGIPAFTALVIALFGTLLTLWAMVSNEFFSGIVRIQQDRGHTVASTGPYQYVRHPGYAGMLIFTFAAPFILDSVWAIGVAVLTLILTIVRTSLEDRTLQEELDGYADYAQRVRYRLVPAIW